MVVLNVIKLLFSCNVSAVDNKCSIPFHTTTFRNDNIIYKIKENINIKGQNMILRRAWGQRQNVRRPRRYSHMSGARARKVVVVVRHAVPTGSQAPPSPLRRHRPLVLRRLHLRPLVRRFSTSPLPGLRRLLHLRRPSLAPPLHLRRPWCAPPSPPRRRRPLTCAAFSTYRPWFAPPPGRPAPPHPPLFFPPRPLNNSLTPTNIFKH